MADRFSLIDKTEAGPLVDKPVFNNDSRMLVLKEGQQLRCRILRFKDALSTRKEPWVTKFVHTVFTKEEDGSFSSNFTVCPSTHHLNIKNWVERCSICSNLKPLDSKLKNATTEGQKFSIAKVIKTLKRKFKLFIPVYIISDSLNTENVGTSKILMLQSANYFYRISDYFNKINKESPEQVDKYFNHFGDSDCFDFILNVDKDNVFEIAFKFERSESVLIKDFNTPTIQNAFVEHHITSLKFDEDFYEQKFDDDKHLQFFDMFAKPLLQKFNIQITENTQEQDEIPPVQPAIFKKEQTESPADDILKDIEQPPKPEPTSPAVEIPLLPKTKDEIPLAPSANTVKEQATSTQDQDLTAIFKQIEALTDAAKN